MLPQCEWIRPNGFYIMENLEVNSIVIESVWINKNVIGS